MDLLTIENGRFLIHCHKTRPTLVLGNTEGPGRLKLVTALQAHRQHRSEIVHVSAKSKLVNL